MNILVVDPGPHGVRQAEYFGQGTDLSLARTRAAAIEMPRRPVEDAICGGNQPDIIAVRVAYGGQEWETVAPMDRSSVERLEQLSPAAPLSLPFTCAWLRRCLSVPLRPPILAVFETGFFRSLPEPECSLALPSALNGQFRRQGYHGIYHEGACRHVRNIGGRGATLDRLLSICLEPRPELAAARGQQPVMVSGGATPLEGILGDVTSGEVDPGIVLRIADAHQMGPEQIHRILTERSGLFGLTGERVTLADVLKAPDGQYDLARRVFLHQVLLSCGAGIAAMGGVDGICFSGCYAEAAPPLARHLKRCLCPSQGDVPTFIMTTPLYQLVAEHAVRATDRTGVVSLPLTASQP